MKAPFYLRVTAVPEHNIFNTPNVDIHRRMRRLMAGPMSESSLKSVEPTVVSHIDFAIRRMKEEMGKRGATDVWTWWTYMATDIIGALTFGESFRTLDIGKANYPTCPSSWKIFLLTNSPAHGIHARLEKPGASRRHPLNLPLAHPPHQGPPAPHPPDRTRGIQANDSLF